MPSALQIGILEIRQLYRAAQSAQWRAALIVNDLTPRCE